VHINKVFHCNGRRQVSM